VPRFLAAVAALVMLMSITAPAQAETPATAPVPTPVPVHNRWESQARSQAIAAYRSARHDAHRLGRRIGHARLRRDGASISALRRTRHHWQLVDRRFRRLLARRAIVLKAVRAQLGTPYRWGGASPSGFDCSGLVMWAYGRAGIALPHSSFALMDSGRAVTRAGIRPGDLVFSYGGGHVGVYMGNGVVIHAPHTGARVSRMPLRSWPLIAIRRIV
jgi:peptidoglycan DL-endopeptidase CwlO